MADIENKYYLAADGVDSVPVTSGRFSRPMVLLACTPLMLMAIVATSTSGAMSPSAAVKYSPFSSTNLIGLSPALRSPSAGAVKPGSMNPIRAPMQLPGSSPFKQIAISALEANNLGKHMRDVSMMATAETKDELDALSEKMSEMDAPAKAEVAKAAEVVKMKARDMVGVTAPLDFFDPVGFSTDCSVGKLLFYREVELKHGRVAMLASLGFLVGEQFHPLFGGNIDVPSYIAFQQTPLQTFWPAVAFAIAIPEIFSIKTFREPDQSNESLWAIREGRQPGDFGFDPLGMKPKDAKEFKEMQNKELNNGRLAMIAAAGMIAQELATGKKLF